MLPPYTIIIHKKAQISFKSLFPSHQEKIREILASLATNPFGYPYVKIRGELHLYRIRIGEYRILYEICSPLRKVIVLKIEQRSKVYK